MTFPRSNDIPAAPVTGRAIAVERLPRVLIVDDDAHVRRSLREILEAEGIVVAGEAAGGSEAIELSERLAFDVVLMDLKMPGMGGFEATSLITKNDPTVQVIILTVYEDASFLTRSAADAGAYAYLVKGCSGTLIRDLVLQACRHRRGLEADSGSPATHAG
jgi:DNA-binding NarL/FixJ family response regulator